MQARTLGRSGLKVSRFCFGTMSFGGDADEAMAAKLFARCRDAGIDTFDCADVYEGGRSEEILGRLVRGCRDEIVLATKAYFPTGPDPRSRGSSRYHLVRAVEASLRRLGTDRIDLFFLHRFDEATPLEESLRALDDLVRQGKILYLGASNFAAWQVMKALGISARAGLSPLVCIQPMYNLVKRQAEVELLPLARSEGLGVLSYSPLGGGLLAGKYGEQERPSAGRLVENAMYGTRYGEEGYYRSAQRLIEVARELGVSPAALALAWVAAHPDITAPLLGARDVAQLDEQLRALEIPMDEPLRERLSQCSPEPPPATDRNEERSAHDYVARLAARRREGER
ncbi:MAG: aldo/keto reductase [Planctomycetes bacterium]|nr:aldo/keto reductase [Planctomycetota bacterium]